VHKRVLDPTDQAHRFERGGFRFRVLDAQGQVVPGSEFATDSTGCGVCPTDLRVGDQYTLDELFSPVPNVTLTPTQFEMTTANQQLQVVNQVLPNTPYVS